MKLDMLKKKLELNKETILSLSKAEVEQVQGGMSGSACGYDTCIKICKTSQTC